MGRCRRFRRVRDYGLLHGLAKGMVQLLQLLLKVVLSPPVMPKPRPAVLCPHCILCQMRLNSSLRRGWSSR